MRVLEREYIQVFLDKFESGEWFYKNGRIYRTKKRVNSHKTIELPEPEIASGIMKSGYRRVYAAPRNFYEHRLIYAIHHGVDALYSFEVIDHIDGDKQNNTIDNLRGTSVKENTRYAEEVGNYKRTYGEINGRCKISTDAVKEIIKLVSRGEKQSVVADKFGITQSHVSTIINGKRRKYA